MVKKSILADVSVAFIANLVSLFGSILITLILPKFLKITEYSYYQLYIFYTSYVGFFGLGWLDGIYLRYGGQYYWNLDKRLFSAQIRLFTIFETAVSIIILVSLLLLNPGIDKMLVLVFFCFCILLYLPRSFLHNILQTTGRIKDYALGVVIEKIVHIILTIINVMLGHDVFLWYIGSELFGRFCAAVFIFYKCRDIVFAKSNGDEKVLGEIKENISTGLSLMVSNIGSMLIVGVIRQSIEITWNVETFGKISLTLAISNLMMMFINSIALVLFPVLKRSDESALPSIYNKLQTLFMIPILGMLVMYYPIKNLLVNWLPQYTESLHYMAILFPISVFESKMSLVINTYMKTLRKERILLALNTTAVGISLVLAYLSCGIMKSLDMAIFSLLIVLIIRCVIAEFILKKYISIAIYKDMILEITLTICFIFSSWTIGGIFGSFIYFVIYFIYLLIKKKDICRIYQSFKVITLKSMDKK